MPECDGCGKCCGPVGVTHEEQAAIGDYCKAKQVKWEPRDPLTCGFLDKKNRCRIYIARPFLCRVYGAVKELPCPYYPEAARASFPPPAAYEQGLMTLDGVLLGG